MNKEDKNFEQTNKIILILNILEKNHQPTMLEQLKHFTPFQLLIATLLSARSKDATVIPIVKELFKDYPNPDDLVNIDVNELEKRLYQIGFYRTKARNVIKLSKLVIEKFNGDIPNNLEDLTYLPGVGRKTANCILSYVYNQDVVAVDIHVHRITNSGRLNWINTKIPEETEQELMKVVPKQKWKDINRLIVDHGQRICLPIKPKCDLCTIKEYCDYNLNN